VGVVLELVKARRLQYYRFSSQGCGCLWWQMNLLDVLVKEGWVNSHSPKKLVEVIEGYRESQPRNRSEVHFPAVEGKLLTEAEVK
jgi:hypothetical protein